ncbi:MULTISPECIES: PIN domain-containing protein [Delftia]|uniref:PIN domain-containing protein n=1 Tax=Delftia TaxID=80865 RepID=UPI00241DA868|nr:MULTISPECIES: PIN domain-containing protein [Delftia]
MNKADIERQILEGPTLEVAISVDTCIYQQHGFRLESGQLRHLEQFSGTPGVMVMSDVVQHEVLAHMVTEAVKAKSKLKGVLEDVRNHWPSAAGAPTSSHILGTETAEAVTTGRLDAFLCRCGGEVINSSGRVDIADLMKRYFQPSLPFERSGDKKHEFPDAVALIALESWAEEHNKPILLVSNDRGWQEFAEASSHLSCVAELDEALELFQKRDATRTQLVDHVTALLEAEAESWDGLHELASLLNSTMWVEDASAMFDYDLDLQVDVTEVKFVNDPALGSLRAIDYSNGSLTIIGKFEATVFVEATFGFVMDGVYLGGCDVSENKIVNFEALITFEEPDGDELKAVDIELVRKMHKLDFGHVGPDYSDEDPTFEKY